MLNFLSKSFYLFSVPIPHSLAFILHRNSHKLKHTHISSQPVELIIYFVLDEVIVLISFLFVFRAFLHFNSSMLALWVPFVVAVGTFVLLCAMLCHVKCVFLYIFNFFFFNSCPHSDVSLNLSFKHRLQAKMIIAFYADDHYL